jgi:hypothetical protein
MPSLRGVEASIAPLRGMEGSLSRERDRDGPIRVVLRRLAAQVCMNVMANSTETSPGKTIRTCWLKNGLELS